MRARIALLALLVAACAAAPAPTLPAAPVTLFDGAPTHDFVDSYPPMTPFAWEVTVRNDASEPAVVDGYDLVGRTPALQATGAVALPMDPQFSGVELGPSMAAVDDLRAVGHDLVGSALGPTSADPWTKGAALIFFFVAPQGDSGVISIRLRYHMGATRFEADLPANLAVCAREPACYPPYQVPAAGS